MAATASSATPLHHNRLVLCLAFVSGFIIMAIELLGGRILAPYFGSSIYVWGSIITVFMLSLSIGYLLGGRLSLHNPNLGYAMALGMIVITGLANTGYMILRSKTDRRNA